MQVKAADDYPAFNGVPRRLLTPCDVYINGEPLLPDNQLYLLLTGPGL